VDGSAGLWREEALEGEGLGSREREGRARCAKMEEEEREVKANEASTVLQQNGVHLKW
jgi:hypothetical protein